MIGLNAVTATGAPAQLEVDLAATSADLLVRQRTRLAGRLAGLSATGWHRRTGCPLWDVADVVSHLGDATGWALEALGAAEAGSAVPRFLQGFHPHHTPHEHVLAGRGQAPEVLLARLRDLTGTLASRLPEADPSAAPAVRWVGGHTYGSGLVGLHVLWDSWLHELDVDAALAAEGIAPEVAWRHRTCEWDAMTPHRTELDAVAAYGVFFAGLAFARVLGPQERVSLRIELADLGYDLRVGDVVRLTRATGSASPEALRISGPAVATVEALAGRGDLAAVAEGDPRAIALMSGLAARMREPATPVS